MSAAEESRREQRLAVAAGPAGMLVAGLRGAEEDSLLESRMFSGVGWWRQTLVDGHASTMRASRAGGLHSCLSMHVIIIL